MLFKEFYIRFIQEGVLNNIPSEELGLSNTTELSPIAPYGFWVDTKGNFIAVPKQKHYDVMKQILLKAKPYLTNTGEPFKRSIKYSTLFDEGWVRVVLCGNAVNYYIHPEHTLTPQQKGFMHNIQYTYDMQDVYRNDVELVN